MLKLTDNAVSAIRGLTMSLDVSDQTGLRIASAVDGNGTGELVASIASGPEPSDEVVETRDVRVYVDSHAAPVLDNMVLDAEATEAGQVRFELGPQPS